MFTIRPVVISYFIMQSPKCSLFAKQMFCTNNKLNHETFELKPYREMVEIINSVGLKKLGEDRTVTLMSYDKRININTYEIFIAGGVLGIAFAPILPLASIYFALYASGTALENYSLRRKIKAQLEMNPPAEHNSFAPEQIDIKIANNVEKKSAIEPMGAIITEIRNPAIIKFIKILGLKEDELLTEEKINSAFERINKNFKGSNRELIETTQNALEARRVLLANIKFQ